MDEYTPFNRPGPSGPAKMHHLRWRTVFIVIGALLVLAGLLATDVDGGIQTILMLGSVASGIVALAFSHMARKALMDYPEADMQTLFHIIVSAAPDNIGRPVGAGLALIAIAIVINGLLGLFGPRAHAQDIRTYVPPQAIRYMPALKADLDREWATHPKRGIVAATFEHESGCFVYKRQCWNPRARLKTSREEGASFIQITRAYRKDGSERFDALQEMVGRYPQLKGWNWGNVYDRPDLALLAGVLKLHEDFLHIARMVHDPLQAVLFTDLAYNAGAGRVSSDRRACGLKHGCDPQKYFGNVELTCTASHVALPGYGGHSPCDISREHVRDVWLRSDKYQRFLT